MAGKLYIVPTPIGNLEDITFRAVKVLKSVDFILAEDTRTSGNLLRHLEISNKMYSYNLNNEHKNYQHITQRLSNGETAALVSDAGTPAISDPGFLLVRECLKHNVAVETLPGATAFVPALVNSGLPADRFCFEGFLPHKKGRQKRLKQLANETRTMIFYESPHRLLKALEQFIEYFGAERQISISRELTKVYEESIQGSLKEVFEYFSKQNVKGEIVIVLAGKN